MEAKPGTVCLSAYVPSEKCWYPLDKVLLVALTEDPPNSRGGYPDPESFVHHCALDPALSAALEWFELAASRGGTPTRQSAEGETTLLKCLIPVTGDAPVWCVQKGGVTTAYSSPLVAILSWLTA